MRRDSTLDLIACCALLLILAFGWSVTDTALRSELYDFAYRHLDGVTIITVFIIVGGAYSLFNLAFHIIRTRVE